MAGILKPVGVKPEVPHKIWGYVMYDGAENLFNEGFSTVSKAPFLGTVRSGREATFAYWNDTMDYLDIEFEKDVNIWDAGTGVGTNSTHTSPLKVYKNAKGIKGELVGDTLPNTYVNSSPSWTQIISLPKGRYRFEFGRGLRISAEWYLESANMDKSFISVGSDYMVLDSGSPEVVNPPQVLPEPYLTGDSSNPAFRVSASAFRNINEAPYKAFDGNNVTFWYTGTAVGQVDGSHYLKIEFDTPKIIEKVEMKSGLYSGATYTMKDFSIYGSVDDVIYELIYTGRMSNNDSLQSFVLDNDTPYKFIKLDKMNSHVNNTTTVGIVTMNLHSKGQIAKPAVPPSWRTVSDVLPTVMQFQDEGMSDLSLLDRKIQTSLGSPQIMTESLIGVGLLYKTSVNLRKYFDIRKLKICCEVINPAIDKILLYTGGAYKKYNVTSGLWEDLSILYPANETDYLTHGISINELSTMPEESWNLLSSDTLEIEYYTDVPGETKSLTVDAHYSPLDEFYQTGYDVVTLRSGDNVDATLELSKSDTLKIPASVRLLSGGVDSLDTNNEWDDNVVNSTLGGSIVAGDDKVWNWSNQWTWTLSESSIQPLDPLKRIVRGNTSASAIDHANKSDTTPLVSGFRPAIILSESTEPPSIENLSSSLYEVCSGLLTYDDFLSLNSRWITSPSQNTSLVDLEGFLKMKHNATEDVLLLTDVPNLTDVAIEIIADYTPTEVGDSGGIVLWNNAADKVEFLESVDDTVLDSPTGWLSVLENGSWSFYADSGSGYNFKDNTVIDASKFGVVLKKGYGLNFKDLNVDSILITKGNKITITNLKIGDKVQILDTDGVVLSKGVNIEQSGIKLLMPKLSVKGKLQVLDSTNVIKASVEGVFNGGDHYSLGIDLQVRQNGIELSRSQQTMLGDLNRNVLVVPLEVYNPGSSTVKNIEVSVTQYCDKFGWTWAKVAPDLSNTPGAWSDTVLIPQLASKETKNFWLQVEKGTGYQGIESLQFNVHLKVL